MSKTVEVVFFVEIQHFIFISVIFRYFKKIIYPFQIDVRQSKITQYGDICIARSKIIYSGWFNCKKLIMFIPIQM